MYLHDSFFFLVFFLCVCVCVCVCVCNSIILQLMIWFIYQSWSLRTQCCIINHISSTISGWNFGVIYLIFKLNFSFCYLHLVLSFSRYHIVQKWSYKLFLDGIWMNIWHVCYSHLLLFFTLFLGIQHWEIATSWSWKEED